MLTDDPLKCLVALQTRSAKEKPTRGAEGCRCSAGFITGRITAADPLSGGHFLHQLPAFHVPADGRALNGNALAGTLLAAGKGDSVWLLTRRRTVAAVRSGTLEASVLPGRSRETLPAEAVQAGQEVGVLQVSAADAARHRRFPLRRGRGRGTLWMVYLFERGGHASQKAWSKEFYRALVSTKNTKILGGAWVGHTRTVDVVWPARPSLKNAEGRLLGTASQSGRLADIYVASCSSSYRAITYVTALSATAGLFLMLC